MHVDELGKAIAFSFVTFRAILNIVAVIPFQNGTKPKKA
jgi:hypothetical protein